ncbi:hypothetical protein U9M48_010117 [Paspalum notatum var. saurae]|uniref:Uncharacterized protein n=1 Tax=Paspalum notatum var. saurae TaxID=547442 RepID=A0AAQ3SU32_PASNO
MDKERTSTPVFHRGVDRRDDAHGAAAHLVHSDLRPGSHAFRGPARELVEPGAGDLRAGGRRRHVGAVPDPVPGGLHTTVDAFASRRSFRARVTGLKVQAPTSLLLHMLALNRSPSSTHRPFQLALTGASPRSLKRALSGNNMLTQWNIVAPYGPLSELCVGSNRVRPTPADFHLYPDELHFHHFPELYPGPHSFPAHKTNLSPCRLEAQPLGLSTPPPQHTLAVPLCVRDLQEAEASLPLSDCPRRRTPHHPSAPAVCSFSPLFAERVEARFLLPVTPEALTKTPSLSSPAPLPVGGGQPRRAGASRCLARTLAPQAGVSSDLRLPAPLSAREAPCIDGREHAPLALPRAVGCLG